MADFSKLYMSHSDKNEIEVLDFVTAFKSAMQLHHMQSDNASENVKVSVKLNTRAGGFEGYYYDGALRNVSAYFNCDSDFNEVTPLRIKKGIVFILGNSGSSINMLKSLAENLKQTFTNSELVLEPSSLRDHYEVL